jgi:hypothetical protein
MHKLTPHHDKTDSLPSTIPIISSFQIIKLKKLCEANLAIPLIKKMLILSRVYCSDLSCFNAHCSRHMNSC